MKTFLVIIMIVLFFSETVFAYIDPGTGSYIFQLAIAGILGSLFLLKTSWRRFVGFLDNLRRKIHGNQKE
jgi:hypothetical protein